MEGNAVRIHTLESGRSEFEFHLCLLWLCVSSKFLNHCDFNFLLGKMESKAVEKVTAEIKLDNTL